MKNMISAAFLALLCAAHAAERRTMRDMSWDAHPAAWHFDAANGCVSHDSTYGAFAFALSPDFRSATFSARLTPQKRTQENEWSVFGIGLAADEKNFWHIALVAAPTNQGVHHTCELASMREGKWLAHLSDKLRAVYVRGNGHWTWNETYAAELTLSDARICAAVKDAAGRVIFEAAYVFDGRKAVRAGRPFLHGTGGMRGLVRELAATLASPLAQPAQKRTSPPPYASDIFVPGIADRATGFFRVAQKDGKWWTIDPLGRGTVLLGVDHVIYQGHYSHRSRRAHYREWNDAHYPSREAWREETLARLKKWGFNALGAGGHGPLEHRGLVHTRFLSMGDALCHNPTDDAYWICPNESRPCSAFPNVFHPLFAAHCDYWARKRCAPEKDDPWLFGYFIDNELAWWGRGALKTGLFDAVWRKDENHSAKKALRAFVETERRRRRLRETPWEKCAKADQDAIKHAFLLHVAEIYFRTTAEAIRRHDPNHLVLGARFAGLEGADRDVWAVAARHCDVVTFNCYPTADLTRQTVLTNPQGETIDDAFSRRYAHVQKPMLVTEWSFPALDAGLPCLHGAGQRFRTQKERAAATALFARTMLQHPAIVGYNYFMWVDEPAEGISDAFPEDSNYGLVNARGEPYPEITRMFADLHRNMGRLRKSGVRRHVNGACVTVDNDASLAFSFTQGPHAPRPTLSCKGQTLGTFSGMLHIRDANGREGWYDAGAILSHAWTNRTLTLTSEARHGAMHFALVHRLVFSPDAPRIRAELVRIDNKGQTPLDVRNIFFRIYSPFAKETEKIHYVPNLWQAPKADAWISAQGNWIGLCSRAPWAHTCRFYWNEKARTQHPDAMCHFPMQTLAPQTSCALPSGCAWFDILAGEGAREGWLRTLEKISAGDASASYP